MLATIVSIRARVSERTHLDAPSRVGKLSKGDSKEVVRPDKADTSQVELVDEAMIPFVIKGRDIRVSRDPTAQDDGDQAVPQDVDGASISTGVPPTLKDNLGAVGRDRNNNGRGAVVCHRRTSCLDLSWRMRTLKSLGVMAIQPGRAPS